LQFDVEYSSHYPHICHCEQPGFGANLKNKSTQEAKTKILLAVSLCCIFMIIEFLGGYLAGSLAIMTDAAHLASDCISFVIGLVAIWLGGRPPDSRMSFGYKRMEVMGAIVSIVSIWILTTTLVMVAIERILSNDFDLNANTMMTISGIGILINIVMVFILHGGEILPGGHGHSHSNGHGHAHGHGHGHSFEAVNVSGVSESAFESAKNCDSGKNLNLRAAMIHVIGDLVQSIGVFFASVLIKFLPNAKIVDPLCTLAFSIIVILTTVRLFKESINIIMDAVPQHISLDDLESDFTNIEGVKSLHHLHVWNHTSNHAVLTVHLVIDLLTDSNTVLKTATQLAESNKYNIKHCTIQIERLTS
ncbi:probable zinc transporter protein DDB_G0283629, partial [Teleopsis dalmanni]|uniref:probable zinc transporter protein DDB_G0283629 n=1 Tax=Teleopsis dalmanni TaxID=139649 RepID=UPI0018CC85A9